MVEVFGGLGTGIQRAFAFWLFTYSGLPNDPIQEAYMCHFLSGRGFQLLSGCPPLFRLGGWGGFWLSILQDISCIVILTLLSLAQDKKCAALYLLSLGLSAGNNRLSAVDSNTTCRCHGRAVSRKCCSNPRTCGG